MCVSPGGSWSRSEQLHGSQGGGAEVGIRAGILSFKDVGSNVKTNPMPSHHVAAVSDDCRVYQVDHISHEAEVNAIIPVFNLPQPLEVSYTRRPAPEPLVICLPGPVPYVSDRSVPYKYNATILEGGREVEIRPLSDDVNIAQSSGVTRSGRVFAAPPQTDAVVAQGAAPANLSTNKDAGQTSGSAQDKDFDELLRIIKMSEYKIVDQLLQTPSKISILSLLLNSQAHRNALMKVLEQVFVERDVTVDQFSGVVGNITSCNNLSFNDDDLPAEGRNHNSALHISVRCNEDTLSNVLIDTGSSLNVLPKSTLDRLSYQGASMLPSNVIVKAFDGSRKLVLGEVDLPVWVGTHMFQITFQVIDIAPAYSCLLGRPWIHEAGVVTSTLHQKLKFVKNGKIIAVSGEEAMLVSNLSSFRVVEADEDVVGTPFQALTISENRKSEDSIASFRDAEQRVQAGRSKVWGKMVEVAENRNRAGLGFSSGRQRQQQNFNHGTCPQLFQSGGFIHYPEVDAILEEQAEPDRAGFVSHQRINNWTSVDIPSCLHISK